MKTILSRIFRTSDDKPVAKAYVEAIIGAGRPEGQAVNPLMLRGLFVS